MAGFISRLLCVAALLAAPLAACAADAVDAESEGPMTSERLDELIQRIDTDAKAGANGWEFTVDDRQVTVIYDVAADRMRIIIPITRIEVLEDKDLLRLMQANFDSALDARYAVAQDTLWATYIHPLSPLTNEQFLVGLAQTVNIVTTYGTSYNSGLFVFGGGDSQSLQMEKLIERLRQLDTRT